MTGKLQYIRWFDELSNTDVPLVGGKNASLGEMYRRLRDRGVRVPNGFAVTAEGYRFFLEETGLKQKIRDILEGLDTNDLGDLRDRGRQLRNAIVDAELPERLREEIVSAYRELSEQMAQGVDVAVRSSATAEDLPDASFAGQQETYLNVHGRRQLLESCKKCFASLFTNRAISYREHKGFDHFRVALSIGVQRMVRSDLASSGVMFSIDTETGFRNAVLINAAWGLGENVVQGAVNPDEFYVFKPTLKEGFRPILQRKLGSKEYRMIYDRSGEKMTKNVPTSSRDRRRFCISDEDVLSLAEWAVIIEEHYGKPMDMEWAKDGNTGELFIVQARPETVQARKEANILERYELREHGEVLVEGRSVGEMIATGPVRVIESVKEIDQFREGEVLVTDMTDPDWEPIMKKAKAIVTNRGGRTCHAAIVSRELGLPAVVGTNNATERLSDGRQVTVSCAEGDTGRVYEGELEYEIRKHDLKDIGKPQTRIMMNVGNPEQAFRLSFLPNDGVGLAREEFIINTCIKIHPLALLNYDSLEDESVKKQIDEITAGYDDKPGFFVDKLAQGVGMIGAAFYPNPVIVRLSDFKTNEYAGLVGGAPYEPDEENPMLGFRGASRYYNDRYKDAFVLECRALHKVREEMGLRNVKVMIPFCRTVEEGKKVQEIMAKNGLERGKDDLEVYVMCELPSNVVLADRFAQIFDGFSIGSNDLTQLTLGVDRDSAIVAPLFDERDDAVKTMLDMAIQGAKKAGRKIGICGQAPSDFPELARFLVERGIDSLSLNPDAVLKTTLDILDLEKEMGRRQRKVS